MRREDICLYLNPTDRARLEEIIADRNSPSKWMAGGHRARHRRWVGHQRDHATYGNVEAMRLALARTLPGGRGAWLAARQDAALAYRPAVGGKEARHHREDGDREARQRHALE